MAVADREGSAGPDRPAAHARGPGRIVFIDALRGLAVVVMIETHTLNALLSPDLRRGTFYTALTYLNGLVAPAFLFCAGLGFAIFLERKNDGIVGLGPAFRSYLGKCLFIVGLGYSLHVPHFSLREMTAAGPDAWAALLQVDILQVIGVALIALLAVVVIARRERSRAVSAAALTGAFLAWWYLLPAGAPPSVPVWLRAYVSRDLSPLFTVVPWGAFLTTGYLAGARYLRAAAAGSERTLIRNFAVIGAACIAVAAAASAFTMERYPGEQYWYWSIEYFLVRLGSVGLVMCSLWLLTRERPGRGSRVLVVFGRESLAIYYAHLIIVYGKDFGWSFVRLIPGGGDYLLCLGLTAGLVALMYLFGGSWASAKRAWPRTASLAVAALTAGAVLTFLFG